MNEDEVIRQFAASRNAMAVRMPLKSAIDWSLQAGPHITGWVEIKCRKVARDVYPTLILSAHKYINAMQMRNMFDIPLLIVVRYTDGLYFWEVDGRKLDVRHGGRADRGDWQDVEPVVHIPVELFEKI